MTQFSDFISQIPSGVLRKTEIHPCSNIVLFKPMLYMGGITFHVTDYHIVIPSEDTPEALFNNKMIHGEKQKILAVNPGDTVTCLKDAPAKPYYSFLIKPDLLHKIAGELNFSGEIRFENFLNSFPAELFQAFKNLEQEYSRQDRFNLMLESLEIQIAALLVRVFKTNISGHPPLLPNVDSYIQTAEEYIRTYYSINITLKDICEKIHVSEYHFIRMFVKKTGVTPHRYLLMVRMDKAKELLRTKQYSVAETAMLCGYGSISAFSSAFKTQLGISPVDYKNQMT
ncbi:MAG: helix-turn-helix transcriptional regulator [Lawsonibacter sp.]